MTGALLIFLGGGVGALLRYLATLLIGGPIATLAVNVTGGFIIGLLAATLPPDTTQLRLLFMTGLLGGFTTFSAFSLDALTLWQRGLPAQAAAYVICSVILSLAATVAGFAMSRLA